MNASHQPMYIEGVNNINKIYRSDISILEYIGINLGEEDTLDDDEHEIIDLDVDLPNMISMNTTFTSTPKYSDSLEGPSLLLFLLCGIYLFLQVIHLLLLLLTKIGEERNMLEASALA